MSVNAPCGDQSDQHHKRYQYFWHGTLERAEAILAVHPELASSDIHIAAILCDVAAVRCFLAAKGR